MNLRVCSKKFAVPPFPPSPPCNQAQKSNVAIYADHTTLYSKCDQASDLWHQLELASGLESDQRDTVDWGKKWLVDQNAGKTQLVLLDRSINTGVIDVKVDGSVIEENLSFKMVNFLF